MIQLKTLIMKKYFAIIGTLICSLCFFSSCEKDENTLEVTTADIPEITSIINSGEWMITYYFDSVKDETSDYQNYVFTFGSDGSLTASNSSTAISGVWSITDSDGSTDDNSAEDVDFNIGFSAPEIFQELSDDWEILRYSNNKIELTDVSGGDGSRDILTFTKL